MTKPEEGTGYVASSKLEGYGGQYGLPIDLGLATSPIGLAQEIKEALQNPRFSSDLFDALHQYPEDPFNTEVAALILNYVGVSGLGPEAVVFNANGSYGAGDEVIRSLANRDYSQVLVPVYSFPNVYQWAIRHNKVKYVPVITEDLNPLSSVEKMLTMSNFQNTVVYLDYPNNPFGLADPYLMRQLVTCVVQGGGVPLIDLAFGEVLGEEFSEAIQYIVNQGGIVLLSLSKTQGIPGSRAGFAILPKRFTSDGYNVEERLVFGLNPLIKSISKQLFTPDDEGICLARRHADRVAEYNRVTNYALYSKLNKLGLRIGQTNLETPIQVVISNLPDFYQRLKRVGIITESLEHYNITLGGQKGYGHTAVRMLTPRPGQLEDVVKRIGKALDL